LKSNNGKKSVDFIPAIAGQKSKNYNNVINRSYFIQICNFSCQEASHICLFIYKKKRLIKSDSFGTTIAY
jgi:hypothetical protein